jgi:hypothetical protein
LKFSEFHWGAPVTDRTRRDNVALSDVAGLAGDAAIVVAPERSETLRVGYLPTEGGDTLVFTFSQGGPVTCEVRPVVDGCDLVFEAPTADIVTALAQMPEDPTFAGRFVVDDRGAGGSWRGPLPPLDLNQVEALRNLPEIPGASSLTQFVLTDSPVGSVAYQMRLDEGRLADIALGVTPDADVFVMFRYEDYLRIRLNELFIADALDHGDLGGDFGKAQMVAGFTQSMEFKEAAYAGSFTSCDLLSDYSRITRHDAYQRFVHRLRDHVAPMRVAGGRP